MGVQLRAIGSRQRCRLAHEIDRHAERRAGRRHDLQHGLGRWVMPGFDQTPRIAQDIVFVFHQMVGWQSAGAFADAHAATSRMQANAQLLRGADLVLELDIVGKHIVVIAGGRAAGEQQLRHSQLCRRIHMLGAQLRPDGITGSQPCEEIPLLGEDARQTLEHVMVRVN